MGGKFHYVDSKDSDHCVNAQADLSRCWARISEVRFSCRGSLGNVSGLGPDWFLVVNASPVTSVPCQTRDITWSPSRI